MNIKVNAQKPEGEFNGIFICGECPGETEEKEGKPFVGLAGRVLDGILEEVGIKREACYITNTVKYRPRNNDYSSFDSDTISQGYRELEEELMLTSPNVIVALGEHALNALTSKKNITKWRGSVLTTKWGIKCIPTIHPAAISREWTFRPLAVIDFIRTKDNSMYKEIRATHRDMILLPSMQQITQYMESIIEHKSKVAFDIETETSQINCIAFATSATSAICIPFWFGSSGSIWSGEQERYIWELIKRVLEDPSIPKIAQNAQYDMTILRDIYGISTQGLWLDTMIAFHAVYPELPKNLGLLTSIYTDVPYYKFLLKTDSAVKFYEYNALDALVTYECAEKIYEEMQEFGVEKFYYEHMHSLIEPLLSITGRGVKIDSVVKKEATKASKERLQSLQHKLHSLVGHELNVNSPLQMKKWLYEELKLKPKYKLRKAKREKTISADEDTLDEFYAETQLEALKVVLEIRECRKILSTYLEVEYDKGQGEERARCSYLITGTETGRLSSRETVYGTGTNLQNIPKGIARRIFIPDPGKTFVNADLSQAEARVVAYLAGEDRLIRVFQAGGDIHCKNAANIFRKPIEQVTKEERELAKRIVHASNYGMGPQTFAKQAGISLGDAKRLLNAYFAEYPRIKLWHMNIASQLRKCRTLITPLGRKRTFFNRWDDSLLKEAFAYIPQSTVADLLNMGLRRVYEHYKGTATEILLQIHDAILVQTPVEDVLATTKGIKELLTIPIKVGVRELIIPVDISVGDNWDELRNLPKIMGGLHLN